MDTEAIKIISNERPMNSPPRHMSINIVQGIRKNTFIAAIDVLLIRILDLADGQYLYSTLQIC